jgi:site-specific DNA recombinase
MTRERNPARPRRVALYARVSSDQQAQGGTIDSQVSAIRARLEADGQVLEKDLCFCDDGVSGTILVRPALERLRDQAAARAIDQVYLLAPDRLARRHAHQMVLMEELQECGVDVVFVNRPLGDTPEDHMLLQMQGVIAEYERSKIMERTRRGRLHAAHCGRVSVLGRAGYGYRYIHTHTGGGLASYEVLEDQARVVRQMFVWVGREGCSLSEVGRRLQQQGVLTHTGLKRWDPSTIWGMLTNPAYKGEAAYGKTRRGERQPRLRPIRGRAEVPKHYYSTHRQPASEHITIPVPALVDTDLFAVVQERLEENRRRFRQRRCGPRFLLQGLVVCGCCAYAITGKGRGVSRRPTYYRCLGTESHRFGGQAVCHNRSQRVEDLDAAVWNDACALLNEPDRLCHEYERRQEHAAANGGRAEQERLRSAIAKVQQSLSRLLDAHVDGLVNRDDFQTRTKRQQERLSQLQAELQTVTEQAQQDEDLRLAFRHVQAFADQVKAGLKTADWATRREILRALVKRVEVHKEKICIAYKVPDHSVPKTPNTPNMASVTHCWSRQLAGGGGSNRW